MALPFHQSSLMVRSKLQFWSLGVDTRFNGLDEVSGYSLHVRAALKPQRYIKRSPLKGLSFAI